MKKIMKFVSLALVAVMALSMTACGGTSAKYNVGVCQLVQHPALDAATDMARRYLDADKENKRQILLKSAFAGPWPEKL